MAITTHLDAMIGREDFARVGDDVETIEPIQSLSIETIGPNSMLVPLLRKPDFQRETNHWTPNQVLSFLESFLDNELIPSIILWKSRINVFVIDGAHRLSALRAWIDDDYGDGPRSRAYFGNEIGRQQAKAAKQTRDLISERIGTYKHVRSAIENAEGHSEKTIIRARNMVLRQLSLQWVSGDADKAESSFFKINTQGTPLDDTEELLLRNRQRSIAIAARSIVRAASGHKYWSKFDSENRKIIEREASSLHHMLFSPDVAVPVKSLDLPIGGAAIITLT